MKNNRTIILSDKSGSVATKLTKEEAELLGITDQTTDVRGKGTVYGPWQILTHYEAHVVDEGRNPGELLFIGKRKARIRSPDQGTTVFGEVSIRGVRCRVFNSSRLFSVPDARGIYRLVDVATLVLVNTSWDKLAEKGII